MGTAYSISNCVAWYRANIGVYSDAGTTPAVNGSSVYQWNDQSGSNNHATQTTSAKRPIYNSYTAAVPSAGASNIASYGIANNYYQPSGGPTAGPAALLFDGSSLCLNIPTSLSLTSTGCTVIVCTRGAYFSPISFGTNGSTTFTYGWEGGSPQKMGIYAGGSRLFPNSTYLPSLTPMVHGFRCSAALGESRIYLGTNQTSALSTNYCNSAFTGGAIGGILNLTSSGSLDYPFNGEIYEIAIFSTPLTDTQVQTVISQMQAANRLRADANTNQIIFIGDSLTAGGPATPSISHNYPWILCQQYGGALKPLLMAVPGQNISQQQSLTTSYVLPLDLSAFAKTVAVVCCGSNDIGQGRTDVQVTTDLSNLCTGLRTAGMKVIIATITPRSTTSGYTTANQATLTSANNLIRAGYTSYADALADWATDPRLADYTNTFYFNADQTHTTDAGDGVKAQIVKAALDPLLSAPTVQSVLDYGTFYTPGRSFAANFGTFVQT